MSNWYIQTKTMVRPPAMRNTHIASCPVWRRCLLLIIGHCLAAASFGIAWTSTAFAAPLDRPQDWPQSRHDAQNLGFVELDSPKSAVPRPWNFDGSGRVWGYEPGMTVWTSAAVGVVEGKAVVAVGSYDKEIYCLDAATGDLLWKFTTGGPLHQAPVLWNDGSKVLLFAGSSDRLVYAIDAALGRTVWVHSVEEYRPTLGGARLSSPCVGMAQGQNAVFIGHWVWDRSLGQSMQRGAITALRAADGKPIWSRVLGDNEITSPIYDTVQGHGRLYLGSANGNIYALDADSGNILFQQTELDAVRSPPALAPLPRPLLITASKYGMVRALDALTGAEQWSYKTGDRITGSPVVTGGDSMQVIVGSYDRQLLALDVRSGQPVWRYSARGGIYSSPALAPLAKPLILASAWDDALHAVSAADGAHQFTTYTGKPIWNVAGLDDSNWSSPTVARVQGKWIALVGSYDGTLRSLPLDERDRQAPPPSTNLFFWLSFPSSLTMVTILALAMTRRHRKNHRQSV